MIAPHFTARIALFARGGDGYPTLPANVTSGPVYDDQQTGVLGELPSREYRHVSGNCMILQRVAQVVLPNAAPGAIVVAWLPSLTRMGVVPQRVVDLLGDLMASNTIVKQWAVVVDSDGAYVSNTLEADNGAAATVVKNGWPASWRKRLPGDSLGDPFVVPPVAASPPTGQRCLGVVVA